MCQLQFFLVVVLLLVVIVVVVVFSIIVTTLRKYTGCDPDQVSGQCWLKWIFWTPKTWYNGGVSGCKVWRWKKVCLGLLPTNYRGFPISSPKPKACPCCWFVPAPSCAWAEGGMTGQAWKKKHSFLTLCVISQSSKVFIQKFVSYVLAQCRAMPSFQ